MTSAEAADQKGMVEAILKARVGRQMSDQASMSHCVTTEMKGIISASTIVKYSRELEKNEGFAMDGRGQLEYGRLLGQEDTNTSNTSKIWVGTSMLIHGPA